ncbi:PilN domain-containing protein [Bacteriovorax sp. Seq25_V]|uniref:PilN domain-containing protein n=1 Tax=Bacteriovorax sp. Seq25_V TaxID=1201288 RepID=UPI00038A1B25|nr:PilN domain-containing protein [Bacteriovorax sp. Seq25_V]EQC43343.1 fimbrial assembly protein PilN [Bacteriovorax sp. Seq25_V]
MIEINLLEKKKPFKLPVVLGVDLNEVNIKPIVIAYILTIIVDAYVRPAIGEDVTDLKMQLESLNAETKKIKTFLNKNKSLADMLTEFGKQIEKLKDREKQVKTIIDMRTNPKNIVSAITKIIPEDMWFDSFEINSKNEVKIEGGAISYRSVGEFITKANELEFFGGSILIRNSVTKEITINSSEYRVQSYSLEGKVTSFGVLE